MNWSIPADIAGALGVIGAAVLGWFRIRQNRLEKKFGLPSNPTRCDDHEKRLVVAEQCHARVETGLVDLTGRVDRVQHSVDRLIDMHLKP